LALVQRLLNFTFQSADGTTTKVSGLRASVHISKAGGLSNNFTDITIYGMSLSDMNQYNTFGLQLAAGNIKRNTVTIDAGDNVNGLSTCYIGDVIYSYIDLNSMPNVGFKVQAQTAYYDALAAAEPTTYNSDSVKISDVMNTLADKLAAGNVTVENTLDQDVVLRFPYKAGSLLTQIREFALEAGIQANVDDNVLVLSTPTTNRQGAAVMVSKTTGMIGSPTYNQNGILVRCLYNPQIKFMGLVQVQSTLQKPSPGNPVSDLLPANGTWLVYAVDHTLESQVPNGKWESTLQCSNPQGGPPVGGG
jgi:hypothetical protein